MTDQVWKRRRPAQARGRVLVAVFAAGVLAACDGDPDRASGGKPRDCISFEDAAFSGTPLGASIHSLPAGARSPAQLPCRSAADLAEACNFVGTDGVSYHVYENDILGAELAVSTDARPLPLGLQQAMNLDAARAHLSRRGIAANVESVEARLRLSVPVCGAGAGALMVWFGPDGRMHRLTHSLEP